LGSDEYEGYWVVMRRMDRIPGQDPPKKRREKEEINKRPFYPTYTVLGRRMALVGEKCCLPKKMVVG
jgi:hypothetical protein